MTIVEYKDLLISEGISVVSWRISEEDSDVIEFLNVSGKVVARAKGLL